MLLFFKHIAILHKGQLTFKCMWIIDHTKPWSEYRWLCCIGPHPVLRNASAIPGWSSCAFLASSTAPKTQIISGVENSLAWAPGNSTVLTKLLMIFSNRKKIMLFTNVSFFPCIRAIWCEHTSKSHHLLCYTHQLIWQRFTNHGSALFLDTPVHPGSGCTASGQEQ